MTLELSKIQFSDPFWLWLTPAACILVWWLLHIRDKSAGLKLDFPVKRKQAIWFPAIAPLLKKGPPAKFKAKGYQWLNVLLLSMMVGVFFAALAGPYISGDKHEIKTKKRDIVLVVDTSIAMILKDYSLNGQRVDRMTFVRTVLARIIKAFSGDKISVVVYSNDAHILVPPTDDTSLLLRQIARIKTELSGRTNEMGKGLALALRSRLKSSGKKNTVYKPVIILLSHGARPVGPLHPLQILPLYKKLNQKLYTVGIGADQQVVRESNAPGLVFDPVNVELLTRLAKTTGGFFYRASTIAKVDPMIKAIHEREAAQEDIQYQLVRYSLFLWPLLAGILLLFIWQSARLLSRGLYRGARS